MIVIEIEDRLFTLEQLSIALRYAAADTLDAALKARLKSIADAMDKAEGTLNIANDMEASAA